MSEKKRYEAWEIRNHAEMILSKVTLSKYGRKVTSDILRQAAETEEALQRALEWGKNRKQLQNHDINDELKLASAYLREAADLRCGECPMRTEDGKCPHGLDKDCVAIKWLHESGRIAAKIGSAH